MVISKKFLNRTPRALYLGEKMNKWNCIKLKSFYIAKETVITLKRQSTEWEKIFANCSLNKGLILRIYIELKNSIPKE
jgi:hypothetical protein